MSGPAASLGTRKKYSPLSASRIAGWATSGVPVEVRSRRAIALAGWNSSRKRSMAVDVRCHAEIAKIEVPPPIAISATRPSHTRHRRRS